MVKNENHPITHHEVYVPRGEVLVGTYANRHIRQYDSIDPRLVVDLIDKGEWHGKIIIDNFPLSETHVPLYLDRVDLIRGHHKARLLFQMGNAVLEEGTFKYEVFSPHGLVGYAHGGNIEFYLASLFHYDPLIQQKADEGGASLDLPVQRYLEKELGMSNLFQKGGVPKTK